MGDSNLTARDRAFPQTTTGRASPEQGGRCREGQATSPPPPVPPAPPPLAGARRQPSGDAEGPGGFNNGPAGEGGCRAPAPGPAEGLTGRRGNRSSAPPGRTAPASWLPPRRPGSSCRPGGREGWGRRCRGSCGPTRRGYGGRRAPKGTWLRREARGRHRIPAGRRMIASLHRAAQPLPGTGGDPAASARAGALARRWRLSGSSRCGPVTGNCPPS